MKQGTLVYDRATDRYDIRFDLDRYGQPKATKSKSYDDNYRYQPGETL